MFLAMLWRIRFIIKLSIPMWLTGVRARFRTLQTRMRIYMMVAERRGQPGMRHVVGVHTLGHLYTNIRIIQWRPNTYILTFTQIVQGDGKRFELPGDDFLQVCGLM